MTPTIEQIFPEYIRLDGDTQPRAEINKAICNEYGEQMKAGDKFPPIDVFFDGTDYWLADGFHRIQAYVMALPGEAIECNVFKGTLQDAQWHSYSVNKTHGVQRKPEDKERAVRTALTHPNGIALSDGLIAKHVGVSQPFASKIRRKLEATQNCFESPARAGLDGRKINTAKIGKRSTKKKCPSGTPSRHMAARIQQPTRVPTPLPKMTALSMPHDPIMGARTLIEVFDADYLRSLVGEISNHLKGLSS